MDLVTALGIAGGFMLLLGVCGIISDYVLPRIKRLDEWIDTLPIMKGE